MKDFILTNNGDISFYQSDSIINNLTLNFFTSNHQNFLLNFYVENYGDDEFLEDLTPQFIFNFNINKIKCDKEVLLNENNEDYTSQQIKIRLDSALGTLEENKNIGSLISLYTHRIIATNDTFEDIKEVIYNSIKDILPNAQIQINKISTIYLDYSNSLLVTIKVNDYNYFYYL